MGVFDLAESFDRLEWVGEGGDDEAVGEAPEEPARKGRRLPLAHPGAPTPRVERKQKRGGAVLRLESSAKAWGPVLTSLESSAPRP